MYYTQISLYVHNNNTRIYTYNHASGKVIESSEIFSVARVFTRFDGLADPHRIALKDGSGKKLAKSQNPMVKR